MVTCVFCDIAADLAPASKVWEGEHFTAFMDVFPWRPGHVLVVPVQHSARLHELSRPTREALFGAATRIAEALRDSPIECDDVHFLINDGRAANQTVPHVHLHVIPRRRGDLWRMIARLALRPIVTRLPPADRARLDRQAASIRANLVH